MKKRNKLGQFKSIKISKRLLCNLYEIKKKSVKEICNFLKIKQGEHRSLHWRGYEYLVKIGLVHKYFKHFCLKYKIIDKRDKVDSKVMHHIDCNRDNDYASNYMYLKDMKIHNKLHQEAYRYLVRLNKVNDYISWFFLQKKKKHQ